MGPIGGNGRGRRRGLVAEINVTPLVDVMLVLLIVFMVTAPMMTQGVDVDLPSTTNKALVQKENPVVISITRDGKIHLGKIQVNDSTLSQQLEAMPVEEKEKPIYLRADKDVSYGRVVELMSRIKQAGFVKLGMITQPEDHQR
ncbi:MAG: protein TolR [Desulfobulbaceae bacterium]|nr:protein TolR [Desulfobulbaceae bacterium]